MRAGLLLLALALAGCRSDSDPGPGGVTVGEARALDAAARETDVNSAAAGAAGNAQ